MSENISIRVRRIVSANLNSLVDAMEKSNADGIMREAIREVERALEDVRSELGKIIAAKAQCTRVIERTREKMNEYATKAEFAVQNGRDDLAEAAIARQIDLEKQIPVIEATLAEHASKEKELEGYAAALTGRIHEMQADLAAFADARRMVGADAPAGTADHIIQSATKRADHAGHAFERAAGMTQADFNTHKQTSAQLNELDQMQRADDIGARLAALKARKAG